MSATVSWRQAGLQRHSVVLDLALGSGLLTFELLRRCPEGGVWALAPPEARGVREQLATLPAALQPALVAEPAQIALAVRFDAVVGRGVWRSDGGQALVLAAAGALAEGGRLVLAEPLPERAPRLHEVLDLDGLGDTDRAAVAAAEEAHYGARPALTGADIESVLAPHVTGLTAEVVEQPGRLAVTRTLLERWFPAGGDASTSSYAHVLQRAGVSAQAVATLRRGLENRLGTSLEWRVATLLVTATRPPESAP